MKRRLFENCSASCPVHTGDRIAWDGESVIVERICAHGKIVGWEFIPVGGFRGEAADPNDPISKEVFDILSDLYEEVGSLEDTIRRRNRQIADLREELLRVRETLRANNLPESV